MEETKEWKKCETLEDNITILGRDKWITSRDRTISRRALTWFDGRIDVIRFGERKQRNCGMVSEKSIT